MTLINLTEAERRHFAAWCAQEAKSHRDMAGQLGQLPGVGPGVKLYETRGAAFAIVGGYLSNTEEVSL